MLSTMFILSIIGYVIIIWFTYCEYQSKKFTYGKLGRVLYTSTSFILIIITGILLSTFGYLIYTL